MIRLIQKTEGDIREILYRGKSKEGNSIAMGITQLTHVGQRRWCLFILNTSYAGWFAFWGPGLKKSVERVFRERTGGTSG